ncbi:hypothetical protein OS493_014642 [Desmophyllum pertusum]|uniref:Uncharacterized protein n=1 Tax=Desmophyllum pertusum TaxID=174260 RepID=A0A9W9YD36_9CNID|nr:hypothetical protein OS493_014642 [Desmophyllum pertusum]
MKFLVGAAVNAPQKLFSGDWFDSEDSEVKFDEKPKFEGKVRCRRARKTSDAPGRDSVSEESDVEGTKPNVLLECSTERNLFCHRHSGWRRPTVFALKHRRTIRNQTFLITLFYCFTSVYVYSVFFFHE